MSSVYVLLYILEVFGMIRVADAGYCIKAFTCSFGYYTSEKTSMECDFWNWSRCTKYKSSHATGYRTCYREECCTGFTDPYCSKAICFGSLSCPNGGTCILPNYCSCPSGFSGSRCSDTDECSIGTSDCEQRCINTFGSYNCDCRPGYSLNWDKKTCSDIDECSNSRGGCSHFCRNLDGSYECYCNSGYQLDNDKLTCVDFNGSEVSINDNITEVVGTNNIDLRCSYVKDQEDIVVSVEFLAKNVTQFEIIATFPVFANVPASLSPFGVYLFGNLTLNNTAASQKEAVIVFNNLSCIHEREYFCRLHVFPNKNFGVDPIKVDSSRMNIFAEVPPKKPGYILIDQEDVDDKHFMITEGENVTFTCSGDVGRPPGKFLWQKISKKASWNYKNSIMSYDNNDGSCSYTGTSNITIMMASDDNQAVLRCVVISQMVHEDNYRETVLIDVFYKARKPILSRQPNQDVYDQTTENIILTCGSNGNPQPSYAWYRNDKLLASNSIFVIWDVAVNSSGSYVCRVHNTIKGILYSESESINITIVEELFVGRHKDLTTRDIIVIIGLTSLTVLSLSLVAVSIIIYKYRLAKKEIGQNANSYDTLGDRRHLQAQTDNDRVYDQLSNQVGHREHLERKEHDDFHRSPQINNFATSVSHSIAQSDVCGIPKTPSDYETIECRTLEVPKSNIIGGRTVIH